MCPTQSFLGKAAEAIRLLGALKKTSTFNLSASCALKVAYSSETVTGSSIFSEFLTLRKYSETSIFFLDRESIKDIELEINKHWNTSDIVDAYCAAIILTLEGTNERARSLLEKLISSHSENSAVGSFTKI